jgi:hypothetical protein
MFRLRAANFKITGLSDLISQSREVPSQLAVATQCPVGWADLHIETTSRRPFSTSNLEDRVFFIERTFMCLVSTSIPADRAFFTTPFDYLTTQSVRREELYVADVPSVDQRYYRSFS